MRDEAARLAAEGAEESDALRVQFNASRARAVDMILIVVLLVFLSLMVAKPGA
jgi:hypothetical protein